MLCCKQAWPRISQIHPKLLFLLKPKYILIANFTHFLTNFTPYSCYATKYSPNRFLKSMLFIENSLFCTPKCAVCLHLLISKTTTTTNKQTTLLQHFLVMLAYNIILECPSPVHLGSHHIVTSLFTAKWLHEQIALEWHTSFSGGVILLVGNVNSDT